MNYYIAACRGREILECRKFPLTNKGGTELSTDIELSTYLGGLLDRYPMGSGVRVHQILAESLSTAVVRYPELFYEPK